MHVGCTTAGIGCIDCKKMLFEGVKADLARIRARGDELRADPARVDAILARGAAEARKVAVETMARVRARLGSGGRGRMSKSRRRPPRCSRACCCWRAPAAAAATIPRPRSSR